jgi:hypothetical protein
MKNKMLLESLKEIKNKLKAIEESNDAASFFDLTLKYKNLLEKVFEDPDYRWMFASAVFSVQLASLVDGYGNAKQIRKDIEERNKNLEKFIKLYPNTKLTPEEVSRIESNNSEKYPLKTFEDTIKSQKVANVTSKL